jgi:23S rRNA G2069 N7-methylase RlmK/C1962 C5-methylase RlmI
MVGEVCVRLRSAERVANQREHIVGIRVASEHRLLEDEVAIDVDVEDPVGAGHYLDGLDAVLPLLEQPRRQTGGVRERPSGDAVLDPDVVL